MWQRTQTNFGGITKFFWLMLSHDSLMNHYKTNFALMQHHKYSLTELENMYPFEREIYTSMLVKHLEEEKARREQENLKMRNR